MRPFFGKNISQHFKCPGHKVRPFFGNHNSQHLDLPHTRCAVFFWKNESTFLKNDSDLWTLGPQSDRADHDQSRSVFFARNAAILA